MHRTNSAQVKRSPLRNTSMDLFQDSPECFDGRIIVVLGIFRKQLKDLFSSIGIKHDDIGKGTAAIFSINRVIPSSVTWPVV